MHVLCHKRNWLIYKSLWFFINNYRPIFNTRLCQFWDLKYITRARDRIGKEVGCNPTTVLHLQVQVLSGAPFFCTETKLIRWKRMVEAHKSSVRYRKSPPFCRWGNYWLVAPDCKSGSETTLGVQFPPPTPYGEIAKNYIASRYISCLSSNVLAFIGKAVLWKNTNQGSSPCLPTIL